MDHYREAAGAFLHGRSGRTHKSRVEGWGKRRNWGLVNELARAAGWQKKCRRRWSRLVASKGSEQMEEENISPGRQSVVP